MQETTLLVEGTRQMKAKVKRDREDKVWDLCSKYYKPSKRVMAYWEHREFSNEEAKKYMFEGCVIEYQEVGDRFVGKDIKEIENPFSPYTEFKTIQTSWEIDFFTRICNYENAKNGGVVYEILSVFKQNEETSEMELLWTKPMPKDEYVIKWEEEEK